MPITRYANVFMGRHGYQWIGRYYYTRSSAIKGGKYATTNSSVRVIGIWKITLKEQI